MKLKLFGKTFEIRSEMPRLDADSRSWQAFLGQYGYVLDADTALKTAAVYRCVDVIAKTMASLPCILYKDTSNGREKATNHPIYGLLKTAPNAETTAFDFWLQYIYNLLLTPGAYAVIKRDNSGVIKELWNVPTANVRLCRNAQTSELYLNIYDGKSGVTEYDFLYTPNAKFSTHDPMDPIAIAGDILKLTNHLDRFADDFFSNGTNLGAIIEYPGRMSAETFNNFKNSWNETYAGVTKAHKVAFLESGYKYTQMGKNPVDSQALESRRFQILEICRFFGVPPHKLFEMDRATYNNIEQANTEFVQEALNPTAVRIEQSVTLRMLNPLEQKRYYPKFTVNALLRGDIATRSNFYNSMRQIGVFSANEIRAFEDMDSVPEKDGGDEYFVNGALMPMKYAKDVQPKAVQKQLPPKQDIPVEAMKDQGGQDDQVGT